MPMQPNQPDQSQTPDRREGQQEQSDPNKEQPGQKPAQREEQYEQSVPGKPSQMPGQDREKPKQPY